MSKAVKNTIAQVFDEIADGLKSGSFGEKVKIGLSLSGSEHGIANMLAAAKLVKEKDRSVDLVLIGEKNDLDFETIEVTGGQEAEHAMMEKLLDSGEISACVTNHYNFPIGVSTVGRIVTPAQAKEMIIATTTGTSATNRIEAMVRNAIAGIIAAKSIGIKKPKLGILNVEGSRGTEKILKELKANGYDIDFAESARADGGSVMRGNDLLQATPDVMVMDSLTGNLMIKIFSSFSTGGSYEAYGYGYGIGLGKNYARNVFIISRASGAPLIANAVIYAAQSVRGGVNEIAKEEYAKVDKAGLESILKEQTKDKGVAEEVKAPEKEVVTAQLSGIDIMDLDDAVKVLWKEAIYAESGMGCTGPIVLVSEKNIEKASELLIKAGYMASEKSDC